MDHPAWHFLGAHGHIVVSHAKASITFAIAVACKRRVESTPTIDQSLVRIPPVLSATRPVQQLTGSIFSILTGASAAPGG